MNSIEEALAAYDEALRLNPGNAAAIYIHKGEILAQLKRYEEALAAYEQTVRLAPERIDLYFKKSHTLRRLGKLEDAQQCYEKARQLRGDVPHENTSDRLIKRQNVLVDGKPCLI
jgi:tetratricopeptide (TPR) repeat protein